MTFQRYTAQVRQGSALVQTTTIASSEWVARVNITHQQRVPLDKIISIKPLK